MLTSAAAVAQGNDSKKSFMESGAYQVKMNAARQKFYSGSFRGALNLYNELYSGNENDALLNFRIGECYLALNESDKSVESLEKAKKINAQVEKDFNYVLGQAYHKSGKLDEAIAAFTEFKSQTKNNKEEYKESDRFISQCLLAKKMMNKPVKNQITNLGSRINSVYDDYACSITSDGKTMVFTSRRPETIGGKIDENDGKYYEDIYISKWDEEKKTWGEPKQLPGKLNTSFHDAVLSISPDGSQIFVYKNIPGETGSGDIYVSKKNATGIFAQSRSVSDEINTSYFESSASITADGNDLYFVSERKGGYGQGDIYHSHKISANVWGPAVNMGNIINSAEDEASVFISADGQSLYFSSNSSKSMGGLDIFKCVYEKGAWSEPRNLGYPINTLGNDLNFSIASDNTAYYSTIKPDALGGRDIYKVEFKAGVIEGPELVQAPALAQDLSKSVQSSAPVNNEFNTLLIAKIDSLQSELRSMKTELAEVKTLLKKQAAKPQDNVLETNTAKAVLPVSNEKKSEQVVQQAVKTEVTPEPSKNANFQKPEKGYYIVLSSSKEKEVAEKNAKNYTDSGLKVFVFKIDSDSWYYVALEQSYTSVKEAKNITLDYRKKKYSGAWYFYVD